MALRVAGDADIAALAVLPRGTQVYLSAVPGRPAEEAVDAAVRLRAAGRDLNFNAYADNRSLFKYVMHTLPTEISESIGTSTLFAAWNAAIYVAQVEDDRLGDVVADGRYIDATREVLRERGGLWFYDESYVISHRRE